MITAPALALAAVVVTAAQGPGAMPSGEHLAFATLGRGVHVGFALVRSDATAGGASIDEIVMPRSGGVSRVLIDRDSGVFFGYRIEAEPLPLPGRFKVAVGELAPGTGEDLAQRVACDGCPALMPLSTLPQNYPAPRIVQDGDAFILELLVNPRAGQRIVDVVRISSQAATVEGMREVARRVEQALASVLRADTFVARGRYDAAIAAYRRALALQPNYAAAINKLGMCYQRAGRLDEAWREYERAVEVDPEYAAVWNNMGSIEHNRERYDEALKRYEHAISLRPDLAAAYMNLGTTYFALERSDEGFEAYLAAYRLDPSIFETAGSVRGDGADPALQSFFIAKIYAAAERFDDAIEFLRKAVAQGFRDFDEIAADPHLGVLVEDPRYLALVAEAQAAEAE